MLYRVAAYTGYRAGELAELTPEHFRLDAEPPHVTMFARDSKGKREEPIPLPLSDVYTSLQTGLIDTAANTPSGAIAFQWHTKMKHMVDLPLSYVVGELLIDKKAFDGLGADDQKAVEAEFRSGFARLDQINRDDNVAARDALKQQGIAITAPDAGERARWEAVGAEVFRKLSEQGSLSPDMLKALTGALDDVRGSH